MAISTLAVIYHKYPPVDTLGLVAVDSSDTLNHHDVCQSRPRSFASVYQGILLTCINVCQWTRTLAIYAPSEEQHVHVHTCKSRTNDST